MEDSIFLFTDNQEERSKIMSRKASNTLLQKAKKAKSDEFYTMLPDIERELQYYKSQFRNKVVYCNCDDPQTSNFYRYFAQNFEKLGLRKVIAACYKDGERDLFSSVNVVSGFYYEYNGLKEEKMFPTEDNLLYFKGNGDFRSIESIKLLKEADIVVTNPPFSLFREFVSQLVRYDKKFLIIGNINAITYKEIFNLIKDNRVWLGYNMGRGISGFIVPDHYELYGTETQDDENGCKVISPNNCLWLTNLASPLRCEEIALTKTYLGNEKDYPHYDNCNGINVDKTQNIPSDYDGLMGVPITFLHKFNPNQFEIVRFRKGDNGKDLSINGVCPYFRILIRKKNI